MRQLFTAAVLAASFLATHPAAAGTNYRMIDLGCLPGTTNSQAIAINNAGQIIGYSPMSRSQAFFWQPGSDLDPTAGTMEPIPTFGGSSITLRGLTDAGQVVGEADDPYGYPHAFYWDMENKDSLVDLTLPGDYQSKIIDMNAKGWVIGFSEGWYGQRAFLWHDGTRAELTGLDDTMTQLVGINNAGQVIGRVQNWTSTDPFLWEKGSVTWLDENLDPLFINGNGDVAGTVSNFLGNQLFRWKAGKTQVIDSLGGPISIKGLGEDGIVYGQSARSDGKRHAFIWQDGVTKDLGTSGGDTSEIVDRNPSGTILGRAQNGVNAYRTVVWQDGAMTDIGSLGGWGTILPSNEIGRPLVNAAGVVTGNSYTADNQLHAFVWQKGSPMIDLGALDGTMSNAASINDAGQVVGYVEIPSADNTGSAMHAFLAYPTDTPPAVTAPGDQAAMEGTATSVSLGSFVDPDGGPWTVTIDWGDYSSDVVSMDAPADIPAQTHSYADNGRFNVTVTVTDATEHSGSATFGIDVANVVPVVSPAIQQSSTEGALAHVALGSFADPGTDAPWSVTVDWGDGSQVESSDMALPGDLGSRGHTYAENGSYLVIVSVADKDNGVGSATIPVTVTNVAPAAAITGPASGALYAVGVPVTLTGQFKDPGVLDTHKASWSFVSATGVTTGGEAAVSENAGSGTATLSVPFAAPGVYSIRLLVTDDDGATASADTIGDLPAYVVVYDPSEGFVTGGGWINSPTGACLLAPTATGRASFGFVARYKKGTTVPVGNTEFQFKAGGLNFRSTSYEWLVVSGARAQYKGYGIINGTGSYAFILTAVDGQVNGSGPDRLRLKIWDRATGTTVYDNQAGTGDNDSLEPVTALGGGSIVIHS